jgi:hypothetical protein
MPGFGKQHVQNMVEKVYRAVGSLVLATLRLLP